MTLLLVAHGTRKASGVAMIEDLAARVHDVVGVPVVPCYVDVVEPTPTQALTALYRADPDRPIIAVPAFLAAGYHVRTDLPAHIIASEHPRVRVTEPLGPAIDLVRVLLDRLADVGWKPGDAVVLAAAGTSDLRAQGDVRSAAAMLSAALGDRVEVAFVATCTPSVPEVVARIRSEQPTRRIVAVSYLIADGLFAARVREQSGADLVTAPLGAHPALISLLARRYRRMVGVSAPALSAR